jgi:oligo-1,6-glucosidase
VLHLHRGTPFVYQGEELGMANAPWSAIEDFRDVESLNHWRDAVAGGADPAQVLDGLRRMSRDNARTPVQWDGSEHAGFTTGTPWLPVHPDADRVNAAVQRDDPGSVLAHYRRLIALRHDEPAVALGDFTMLLPDHPAVYAFLRRLGDVQLLVLANLSGQPVEVDVPTGWDGAEVVLDDGCVSDRLGALGPWESRVHRRRA